MVLTPWDRLVPWACCVGPIGLAVLLAAVAGVMYGRAFRPRGPEHVVEIDGLCERCGYDMRGTPERCPECGWVPELFQDV